MIKTVPKTGDNAAANDVSPAVLPALKIMFGPTKNKGRGVICAYPIQKGETIEYAPVVPLPKSDIIPGSVPDSYVLVWHEGLEDEQYCLAGGFIMLYNHSENANVSMTEDRKNMAFVVKALRNIEQGEELTWNYNCELWFDPN